MPQTISKPRDLFIHHLNSMLFVEQTLVDEVLPEVYGNVVHPDLKADVEHHLDETRQHVRNLETIFEMLGERPDPQPSGVLHGLGQDYHQTLELIDGDPLRDLFHTQVIAKNEHVEIAAYDGLIEAAKEMDEDEIANLLNENLDQEEEALKKAEKGMKKLLKSDQIPV
jgi:ferritin-like metal-binding protein YciE